MTKILYLPTVTFLNFPGPYGPADKPTEILEQSVFAHWQSPSPITQLADEVIAFCIRSSDALRKDFGIDVVPNEILQPSHFEIVYDD